MKTILCFSFISIICFTGCNTDDDQQPRSTADLADTTEATDALAAEPYTNFSRLQSSNGQTIYVPVYSHIYQQNQQKTFNLTATLSFRNVDLNESLTLTKVLYYDSQGDLVKNFLDSQMTIKPLASTSFVIEEDDLRGGVGANFIMAWESQKAVFPPVVEAVMISTSQQQGISFVSRGRVLENQSADSLYTQ